MTVPNAAHFGAIIRDLIDAGMSQGEIAAAAMVAQSEISRLRNGKRRRVTYETGARLLELHRATMSDEARYNVLQAGMKIVYAKATESPPANATPVQATQPSPRPLPRSDAEVEALARELGIFPRVGETYAQLKARCLAALCNLDSLGRKPTIK